MPICGLGPVPRAVSDICRKTPLSPQKKDRSTTRRFFPTVTVFFPRLGDADNLPPPSLAITSTPFIRQGHDRGPRGQVFLIRPLEGTRLGASSTTTTPSLALETASPQSDRRGPF